MAKTTRNTNKKQVQAFLEANKYNENISYSTKSEIKFEHTVGSRVKYIGGMHIKGAICTITKQVANKGKIYYSVIFDNTDTEVNWIMEHLLKKIEVVVPVESIEVETINPNIVEREESNET